MSKELKKIGNLLILQIIFVFFLSFLALILIISLEVASKATARSLNDLDNTAKTIASHLTVEKKLPAVNDVYQVFVIDQKDEFFIYERPDRSYADKMQWERYKTKLIYEMQKQKNGWAFYPTESGASFTRDVQVLRYINIDEFGWILVTEGALPGKLSIIKGMFDRNTIIYLLLIFLFSSGLISIFAKKHHIKVKKNLTAILENGMLNITHESFFKDSKISNRPFEKDVASKDPFLDKALTGEQKPSSSTDAKKKDESINFNEKIDLTKKSGLAEQKKSPKVDKKPKEEDALDDITIELQGIQSPLLRKMIKEFREH